MDINNRHIILRQRLDIELSANSRLDRHAVAEEFSRHGRHLIPKLLDDILSAEAGSDRFKRLHKLELVVELDDFGQVEDSLRRQLPELIREALLKQLQQGKGSNSASQQGPGYWLLHFLENGYFPWNAPQDLSVAQLDKALGTDKAIADQLINLLLHNDQALIRFLRHLGWKSAGRLLRVLGSEYSKDGSDAELRRRLVFTGDPSPAQLRAWRQLLRLPPGGPKELHRHPQRYMDQPDALNKHFLRRPKENQPDPIFVSDAGMVLMHPFVTRLFDSLSYIKDQRPDSAKAAALLHFLVWGAKPLAEWDLVLPKILLEVPLNEPLIINDLNANDLAEGESMLAAIIQHWSVLKNTSINGFRESFLQRPGRLIRHSGHWQIRVDQRPFDILLDQLPWSIQIIRLPWMAQPLYVDWI